jgi:hypothetical protein
MTVLQFAIQQDIQPKDAVAVAIVDPRDGTTPTGISITLAGRYTKAYRGAQAMIAEQMSGGKIADAEAIERLRDLIVACTLSWDGVNDAEGAPVACTPEAVRALYTQVEWCYEQVRSAYLDGTRFFESAKAS